MNSTDMARLAAGAAQDKKALDPVVLDIRGLSSVSEYFVIVTGTSDRHVQAVAENVMDAFDAIGVKPLGEEGLRQGKWVLLDYGEVVITGQQVLAWHQKPPRIENLSIAVSDEDDIAAL